MLKKYFLLLLVGLLLLGWPVCIPGKSQPVSIPPSAAATADVPQYLVLISIDAGRPEYLDLAPLPNLHSLIKTGTFYMDAWVGSLENNTPPGHTEMATGSFPRSNGILNFSWTNVENGQKINPTSLEAVNRGEMAAIVQQSRVPTISGLIKSGYPDGKVIVVSSHKFYAAQGLGVGPSDYIVYAQSVKQSNKSAATQGVELPSADMLVPVCVQGHELPADVLTDPTLRYSVVNPGDDSRFVFNVSRILFEKYQPRALLLNLPETDSVGHRTGGINAPESIRPVMEAIDEGLGELMTAYKNAGIFGQTLWVITADHGMTPNIQTVDGEAILQASLSVCPRCRVNGTSQYLGRPDKAVQVAESIARAGIDGVNGVYARVKNGSTYLYQPASGTKKEIDSDLNKAYLYLLSTFAGPNSPDIFVATNQNILAVNASNEMGGKHSAPNWADQHIFLVLSGPGTVAGKSSSSPARLADILPTVVRLMQLEAGKMDGIVLGDALLNPLQADMQTQEQSNSVLTLLRDALKRFG
jgi:predicted AlkP superfamily pyrophosphatase or phosphodiesterase